MARRLQEKDMDILEQWIGTGPKTFTLLYKITRDGCSATTFHQKCDDQGATVTVLFNQHGSVYGGYASQSWNSGIDHNASQSWNSVVDSCASQSLQQRKVKKHAKRHATDNHSISDYKSFLFQLYYSGTLTANTFKNKTYKLCGNPCYGPTFGNAPGTYIEKEPMFNKPVNQYGQPSNLHTFSGIILQQGGLFPLNGNLSSSERTHANLGDETYQINNGSMHVKELEVYKVTGAPVSIKVHFLACPKQNQTHNDSIDEHRITVRKVSTQWRKTPIWNEKFLESLKEDLVAFQPMSILNIQQARVLLIGPVGAGKSSFYNTINSIFKERISTRACSGSAEQSLSTAYTQYEVSSQSGAGLNFRLCDTRGLEISQGLDVLECNYLLDGNVPDYYEFNPASSITPSTPGFVSKPTPGDKIHCVAFVVDASTLDVLPTKMIEKMKNFQKLMNQKGIPQAVVLTKIDKLCKEVESNVSKAFQSEIVMKHVDKASQILGLPRGNILPVKNYENEVELDANISILALLAMRQMLNSTEDYLENLLDRKKVEQRGVQKMNIKD